MAIEQRPNALRSERDFGTGICRTRSGHWSCCGRGGRWDFEPLPRTAATTAEDESSAVLYSEFEGRGVLLTGNAGVRALEGACTFAERLGIDLPASLRLMQVPNQGRPDNLSSRVLDRIAGERPAAGQAPLHEVRVHLRGPRCALVRLQNRERRASAPRRPELRDAGHAAPPRPRHARARLAPRRPAGRQGLTRPLPRRQARTASWL